jgi:ubiquinone/menaquinone biosynthesis C-methylase UbiE
MPPPNVDELVRAARAAGWPLTPAIAGGLSDYERDFLRLELTGQRTRDYYRARLAAIGMAHGEHVLDAACGVGQWSLVLAEGFGRVTGVDLSAGRLATARALAAEEGRTNGAFVAGELERLPLAADTCDAVFCYGAFMFTDMRRTLHEFYRVLRPGGRVYLNANSTGWCVHLLLDRGLRRANFGLVRAALRMAGRTVLGRESQIVVRERWLRAAVAAAGFRVRALDTEGGVRLAAAAPRVAPAYPPRCYGLRSILELVAEK